MISLNSPFKTFKLTKINLLSILDRKENKLGSQHRNLSNHIYYINLDNNNLLLMYDTTENTNILASYNIEYDETDTTFYLKFTNDGGSSYSDVPTTYGDGGIASLDDIYCFIFNRIDNDPKLTDTTTELTTGKVAVVNAEGLLKKSDKTYDNINNVLDLTEYSDTSNKIAVVNSSNTLKRSDRTYGDIMTISSNQTINGVKTFGELKLAYTCQEYSNASRNLVAYGNGNDFLVKSSYKLSDFVDLASTQTITGQKILSNLRLDNPTEDTTLTNSIITIDSNNQIKKSNVELSTATDYSEWMKMTSDGNYKSVFMNSSKNRIDTITKDANGLDAINFNKTITRGSQPDYTYVYYENRDSTYIALTDDNRIIRAISGGSWVDISDGLSWKWVSVGSDGELWAIVNQSGGNIRKRNATDDGWDQPHGGQLVTISISNTDNICGTNQDGHLYRTSGFSGVTSSGLGGGFKTQSSIGEDGVIYAVFSDNSLRKYAGNEWSFVRSNVKQVSYDLPYLAILNTSDDIEMKYVESLYLNNSVEDTTLTNSILTINSSNQIIKSNLKNRDINQSSLWRKLDNIECKSVFMTTVVDKFRFDCVFTDNTIGYVDSKSNITLYTTDPGDTFTYIEKRTIDKDYIIGVTTDNRILYHYDDIWHDISHGITFKAVSMGSDGTIWALGTNRTAYAYTGSGWSNKGGLNDYISVANASNIVACNSVRPYIWKGAWSSVNISWSSCRHVVIDENGVIYARYLNATCYKIENEEMTYIASNVYGLSYNDYCLALRYSNNTVEYYPMLPPSLVKKLKQLSAT